MRGNSGCESLLFQVDFYFHFFSRVALASSRAVVNMIASMGYKREYKKTGSGQGKSPMQGGQGEASWKGAFILAVTSCENETVTTFIGSDACK